MPVGAIHTSKKNPVLLKIILWILLLITVVIGAGFLYWNANKKEIVRTKIEKAFTKEGEGLYIVDYSDMVIDELKGNLSLSEMIVTYDTAKYAAKVKDSKAPPFVFRINIPEISIEGLKTPKAMMGKELIAKKLRLINPSLEIINTHQGKNKRNIPEKELYLQILGELKLIQVDTVEFIGATITTMDLIDKKPDIVLHNANLTLTELRVDSASNADITRVLFAKDIDLSSDRLSLTENNPRYDYSIEKIKFNTSDKAIRIMHVTIKPLLGEDAFAQSRPTQSDRIDAEFKNIRLTHVNLDELMNETLVADELEIGHASIRIYRDLNRPWNTKNLSGTYPHQQIMEIPIPFNIRKGTLPSVFIELKEKNDITGLVGSLQFHDSHLSISNLTNMPAAIRRNNISRLDISTRILDLMPFKGTMHLSLGDPEGKFSVKGSTLLSGPLEAKKLNPLTKPTGAAIFKEGTLKKLEFSLTGNNTRADGQVTILYNDLKVELLEIEDPKEGLEKKNLATFFGNMMIKDENPNEDDPVRVAEVHHERNMTRSFFNLIWKSIYSGVNKTIGNKKPMKRP